MTNFKHLSKAELTAYSLGSSEKTESHDIGKHLLNCPDCRRQLPMPSVDRLWSAIMTETEIYEVSAKKESKFTIISIFTDFYSFLKLQSGLVWSSAALIILLSFSFMIWLSAADSGSELVQTIDNELGSEFNFPLPAQTLTDENSSFSNNSNRTLVGPTPKRLKSEVLKPKISLNNLRQTSNKPNLKPQKQENTSATRNVSAKCSENKTIEVEFLLNKENLVFKWKPVPTATKYHLYISDDEEILIDEYETEAETTFVLKKQLDPLKTYKWKIIVTLENGQTVVGDSQKFTMKDFQLNQKKVEKKSSSDIRCSANG